MTDTSQRGSDCRLYDGDAEGRGDMYAEISPETGIAVGRGEMYAELPEDIEFQFDFDDEDESDE